MEHKQLLLTMVQALVDQPNDVTVSEYVGDDATTYEVHVGAGDQGKVIGKQGRIANALRTILKSSAMREKRKVYVEIAGS